MKQYDVVVIGAGPGGYESALELAKSGLNTLLIDRNKERIGGTCLNEGCVSSKAYLEYAEYLSKASNFRDCGITVESKDFNMGCLRDKTVALKDEIRSGVVWLLDQAGVEVLYGSAKFLDSKRLEVSQEEISFKQCIIATGSKVREFPLLPTDGKQIISSREVFDLDHLPVSLTIVGGGPIGCEFATFFNAFGVEVTIIARSPQLLSSEDEDVSKALLRAFKKRNIKVITSAHVTNAQLGEKGVELEIEAETQTHINSEMVLCAVGRIPYTDELGLDKAGVALNEQGYIEVNASFQTSQGNIYAVGDCINTFAFAHTAYAEARIAAENIIKGASLCNTHITPSTTFTNPQVASCGLTEKKAKEQGLLVEVKKTSFKVNTKAKIMEDDSGFAKIIISAQSGVILGASIIGPEATEIIHELVLAIEKKLTHSELKEMIHAHPSVSEIIRYL